MTLPVRFQRRFSRPGGASVWPVQLVFRDAHRPAIVHGVSPAVRVTALIAEDLASEHDHIILTRLEIRIPATFFLQRSGEGLSQRAGNRIVCLEFQEGPDRRLGSKPGRRV